MNLKRIKLKDFKEEYIKKLLFVVIENNKKTEKRGDIFFYIIKEDVKDESIKKYFYLFDSHFCERNYKIDNEIIKLKDFLKKYSKSEIELSRVIKFFDEQRFLKINKIFLYFILKKRDLKELFSIYKFIKVTPGEGDFKVDVFGFDNKNDFITKLDIHKDNKYIKIYEFVKLYFDEYKNLDWYEEEEILLPFSIENKIENKLKFNVIKGEVLDAKKIYRGFISAKDLVDNIIICNEDTGFQRNIYKEHVKEIIKFLEENTYKYKYFPEITIAIYKNGDNVKLKHLYENLYEIEIDTEKVFKKYDCNEEIDSYEKIWEKRKYYIIDGRHRLSALKKYLKDRYKDIQIPITIILVEKKDEYDPLAFFYYINQRQKPLISEDYLNLVKTFEKEGEKLVYDWNILDILLFHKLNKEFKENEFNLNSDILSVNILNFIKFLKESKLSEIFYHLDDLNDKVIKGFVIYCKIITNYLNVSKENRDKINNLVKELFSDKEQSNNKENCNEELIKNFFIRVYENIKKDNNKIRYYNYQADLIQKIHQNRVDNKFYILMYLILYYTKNILEKVDYLKCKKENFKQKKNFNIKAEEYVKYYVNLNNEKPDFLDLISSEIVSKLDFFLEYRKLSNHLEKPESVIKIIEELYVEKSRVIFYSSRFAKEYEKNYYIVKDVVSEIEKELGIKIYLLRLDKPNDFLPYQSFDIHNTIINLIKESGLLIADISGKSPNVYHEIGLRMGIDAANNRPPNLIIISDEDEEVEPPFNINNLQYIKFENDIHLKTLLKEKLYKYFVPIIN